MALTPIASGLALGIISSNSKRLEDSVRAGENIYFTSTLQIPQAHVSISLVSKLLESLNYAPIPWVAQVGITLSPLLMGLARKSDSVSSGIKTVLKGVQNHLGSLLQLVSLVSAVALYTFGQTYFATAALLMLGIGYLDRNQWLPLSVRHIVHQLNPYLLTMATLVTGGWMQWIFVSVHVGILALKWYAAEEKPEAYQLQMEGNCNYQQIRNGQIPQLTVNKRFIHFNPMPTIPDIDIEALVESFEQISWVGHMGALRAKLNRDPRFVGRYQTTEGRADEELVEIAKNTLTSFVNSVKNRSVREGEPGDYETLENYLKVIAKFIRDQSDETNKVDTLLRLAIEGGEYCGPGKFEVAESVYAETLGEDPEVPFTRKVLACFQDERDQWFRDFYYRVGQVLPDSFRNLIDWSDVHNYNVFLGVYGARLGVRKSGAENDDTTMMDPVERGLMKHFLGKTIEPEFWRSHTVQDHISVIRAALGTPRLPKPAFYAFLQDWVERQQISEERKGELHAELETAHMFGQPIEVQGRVQDTFISLLLMEMGIFEEGQLETVQVPTAPQAALA